jgi:hypothetical protein
LKKAIRFSAFLLTTICIWLISTSLIRNNSYRAFPQEKVKYLYIGMEKCASVCHNNKDMGFQYDIVKKSPHSNAFKVLVSQKADRYAKKAKVTEDPSESPVCLKCHITGAGLDPSSFATTYRKDEGVTCEACHKGEYITKTFIPVEADCLKCHNNSVHRTSRFIFSDKLALIAHQRPASNSVKQQ